MPEPIIHVDNISKVFHLAPRQISMRHEARHVLARWLRSAPPQPAVDNTFYALRDVSFTVSQGESVALVGRNGSGKTTLLRIMTRIMRPTTGRVTVSGRYTALIGLGAGFIPTMTGRENIYLNAAIHGLKPAQTDSIIKDIIAFADLGAFIDMPVKDYSSGMGARLGFSVAVHILPEIIFLDEVLAVGDATFQDKCIERILSMRDEGRTIVFVSHSPSAVRLVCKRAIWLDNGSIIMDGKVDEVLNAYQRKYNPKPNPKTPDTL